MANPRYVANATIVGGLTSNDTGAVQFTDDLVNWKAQVIPGLFAYAGAAGDVTDIYYDGTTIVGALGISGPGIVTWTSGGGWALALTDNTLTKTGGTNTTGIAYSGTSYVVAAQDSAGNTVIYWATNPYGPWTQVALDAAASFNPLGTLLWSPQNNLFIATGNAAIWTGTPDGKTWTKRVTAPGEYIYAMYTDGTTYFALSGTTLRSSTNGTSWGTVSIPGGSPLTGEGLGSQTLANHNGTGNIFFDGAKWIAITGVDSGHVGVWHASPAFNDWHEDIAGLNPDSWFSVAQVGTTYYAGGVHSAGGGSHAWMSNSTDGETWVARFQPNAIGGVTIENVNNGIIAAPDNVSFGASIELLTGVQVDAFSADAGLDWTQTNPPGWTVIVTPAEMPAPPCVDFELQTPGDMPDTGAEFTGQRLYITANLNVSGVPQVITPVLIIDGVENTLPDITNMGRGTIEIPISKYHGRLFDGVRLTGCLTGRVEIFRVEADVWLGEQQNG